jgi:hypothetical protein
MGWRREPSVLHEFRSAFDTYTNRKVGSVAGCAFRGGNAPGDKILENEGDLERLAPLLAGAENCGRIMSGVPGSRLRHSRSVAVGATTAAVAGG